MSSSEIRQGCTVFFQLWKCFNNKKTSNKWFGVFFFGIPLKFICNNISREWYELMFYIFSSGRQVHPLIRFQPNKNGILRLFMGDHEFYCKESSSIRAYWACIRYRKTRWLTLDVFFRFRHLCYIHSKVSHLFCRCPARIQTFTKDTDIKFIELKHNHK